MPSRKKQHANTTLVLSAAPERRELRSLQSQLEHRRDQLAELDLEIETLREQLAAFEGRTRAVLATEYDTLSRVEALTRHIERWADLLNRAKRHSITNDAVRLENRRARELEDRPSRYAAVPPAKESPAIDDLLVPDRSDRLKAAYRALARRFHPDLARTEDERVRFGQVMGRINAMYREGDLARLESMEEQAKGGEIDAGWDDNVETQLGALQERLLWFDTVLENLNDERADLESSGTCQLLRNVEQGSLVGRDVIGELRRELQERVERSFSDVPSAIRLLESEVRRYNRDASTPTSLQERGGQALDRVFDPFADKRLIRIGLDSLAASQASPAAQQQAKWIEVEGPSQPAVLRLLLLCYVSELSPYPLLGLETYDDLKTRFDHLAQSDPKPATLEKALVDADDMVELGVRHASGKTVQTGLRFRNELTRDAVPIALTAFPVRRELKRILQVLGDHTTCSACQRKAFAIPLFRTRGLDDLRATVCPLCGHTLSSYWMPKGDDVQAVLNTAYVDFEIVVEYSFRIARTSVATQLLPVQIDSWTVGDLKKMLFRDLFNRYDLGLSLKDVRLHQDNKIVREGTPLGDLTKTSFTVRFNPGTPVNEADAVELLRHRIRNRFKS